MGAVLTPTGVVALLTFVLAWPVAVWLVYRLSRYLARRTPRMAIAAGIVVLVLQLILPFLAGRALGPSALGFVVLLLVVAGPLLLSFGSYNLALSSRATGT